MVLRADRPWGAIRRQCHGRLSHLTATSSLEWVLILTRAAPQRASNANGVDASLVPPRALVAGAMNLAVVDAAERDHEFITHPPAQRSWLHEAEVVGIGMPSPANETRLFSNKPQMLFVAMASRLCNRNNALVDTDRDAIFRADRGICCHRCR